MIKKDSFNIIALIFRPGVFIDSSDIRIEISNLHCVFLKEVFPLGKHTFFDVSYQICILAEEASDMQNVAQNFEMSSGSSFIDKDNFGRAEK